MNVERLHLILSVTLDAVAKAGLIADVGMLAQPYEISEITFSPPAFTARLKAPGTALSWTGVAHAL
jgi:hypothetical protein